MEKQGGGLPVLQGVQNSDNFLEVLRGGSMASLLFPLALSIAK